MRSILSSLAIVVIFCTTFAHAEPTTHSDDNDFSLQWEHDFGQVFVSTQPITTDEAIFLRTSSSSLSQGIPTVYSLDFDGNENWRVANTNSTMQDMSPLEYVKAGEGNCGSWPAMVLVGWSDGLFQALDATSGHLIWQHQTEVFAWGITGSMLVEDEFVTIPTRNEIVQLCLNGDLQFNQSIGNGWRNGITQVNGAYWSGDENGWLWSATEDNISSYFIGEGKIRHPPIELQEERLLIHLQTSSGSAIYDFNTVSKESTIVRNSGFSPGKPIVVGEYIITTDSRYLTSILCTTECEVVDFESSISNGEISEFFGDIIAPQNTAEGGYKIFHLGDNGTLHLSGTANYHDDWYGTSGVASWTMDGAKHMLLVNDNANLKLYSTSAPVTAEQSQQQQEDTDWPTILAMLCALILISTTSISLLREKFHSAFKFFTLFCTVLLYFTLGDLMQAWSDLVNEDAPASDAWDNEWPEEWMGTQVIIFEFKDQSIVTGGLIGHETVLELTKAAALEQEIDVEIIDSSLGKYVVSINNVAGEGWEYSVNGQPGTVSAEYSEIQFDSIVLWKVL